MRRAALALVGLLALPGAAKDPLAGRLEGPPVRCISDTDISSGPTIVDEHTILYSRTGRRIWAVHPVGACPSLRPFSTLIVEKYGSQTCANDRFRVVEPGISIPSGYCRFGPFVPYDKPKR
jgi:hypothetical protein